MLKESGEHESYIKNGRHPSLMCFEQKISMSYFKIMKEYGIHYQIDIFLYLFSLMWLNIISLQALSLFGLCLSGNTQTQHTNKDRTNTQQGAWICVDGRRSGAQYPSDYNWGGGSNAQENTPELRFKTKRHSESLQSNKNGIFTRPIRQ